MMRLQFRPAGTAAILIALALTASPAVSQQYPARPVQIFVGTTAGGAVDIIARALAEDFGSAIGGNFTVINKEGRNNTVAATLCVPNIRFSMDAENRRGKFAT